MAELHVRNIPADLHERLRERAIAERRSMSAEAIALLREALFSVDDRSTKNQAAIERLREIRERSRLSTGLPASELLVREDRDLTE